MLSRFFSGKKNVVIAGLLMLAMCLPLYPGALAASPPSVPESLTAVPGNGQVGLIWFAPEDDGDAAITGYQVSMDGGATWVDVGLATSYTFDGLTGGIVYMFLVRAVNSAGFGEMAIVNAIPKDAKPDANANGNQQGQGQVITGGGGGGVIVEPPPPPPPPEDDPPVTPPPKKEEPQPEDYIPIEIDPEEVTEKPFRVVKPKIMDLVGTYTIIASGTQAAGDKVPTPNTPCRFDCILDFKATHVGGTMSGDYTGVGSFNMVMDSAFYAAAMPNFTWEFAEGGPLTNITFTLYPSLTPLPPLQPAGNSGSSLTPLPPLQPAGNSGSSLTPLPPLQPADNSGSSLQPLPPLQPANNSGSSLKPLPPIQPAGNSSSGLTPLPPLQPADNSGSSLKPLPPLQPADNSGSSLKPLPPLQPADSSGSSLTPLPPLKPRPPAQAIGNGTMYWNASIIQDRHVWLQNGDTSQPYLSYGPTSLAFDIVMYTNGTGIVTITRGNWRLSYKAQLVKGVSLVDIK
ncbi:MAG: fibronectin type III domain-containing protein [Clostridiales bacterium]|nr:fibronectin type III domain-containing protein [Clostridiales bacterium]